MSKKLRWMKGENTIEITNTYNYLGMELSFNISINLFIETSETFETSTHKIITAFEKGWFLVWIKG